MIGETKIIHLEEESIDMDEEVETKAIEKWLRMVDKPIDTKEADKKDEEPREKSSNH